MRGQLRCGHIAARPAGRPNQSAESRRRATDRRANKGCSQIAIYSPVTYSSRGRSRRRRRRQYPPIQVKRPAWAQEQDKGLFTGRASTRRRRSDPIIVVVVIIIIIIIMSSAGQSGRGSERPLILLARGWWREKLLATAVNANNEQRQQPLAV